MNILTTFLSRFAIFGVIGWCLEILWTGLGSLIRGDFSMKAKTSILMFFVYGSGAFFQPLVSILQRNTLVVRGLVYMTIIFVVEYAAGMGLKKANSCPWDYSEAKTNVSGVIRLDYAPLWFGVGLLFEAVHLRVDGVLG